MAESPDLLDDLDDGGDDPRPPGPARRGHYDRPKDVKRREEVGELMARFNWAAKARGMSQTEVSLMVGTDQLRFNRDVNVVVKHGYVNPKMLIAYQAILKLSLEYATAEKGNDVPEDRRLEPIGDAATPTGPTVDRILADNGVVGRDATRDVITNALLLHQFRLSPGEVLELLAIKQQREREEAARRIRQSLERLGGGE